VICQLIWKWFWITEYKKSLKSVMIISYLYSQKMQITPIKCMSSNLPYWVTHARQNLALHGIIPLKSGLEPYWIVVILVWFFWNKFTASSLCWTMPGFSLFSSYSSLAEIFFSQRCHKPTTRPPKITTLASIHPKKRSPLYHQVDMLQGFM